MISWLRRVIGKISWHTDGVAKVDPASWITHFLIAFLASFLFANIFDYKFSHRTGIIAGFIVSDILLLYFTYRETKNLIELGHIKGKKKDCFFDYLGPLLNHVGWFYAVAF